MLVTNSGSENYITTWSELLNGKSKKQSCIRYGFIVCVTAVTKLHGVSESLVILG